MQILNREKSEDLMGYLKIGEDNSLEAVASALSYFKLRKVKRMLLENQQDLEKTHSPEEYRLLQETHIHLKKMEMDLSRNLGTVIIR